MVCWEKSYGKYKGKDRQEYIDMQRVSVPEVYPKIGW